MDIYVYIHISIYIYIYIYVYAHNSSFSSFSFSSCSSPSSSSSSAFSLKLFGFLFLFPSLKDAWRALQRPCSKKLCLLKSCSISPFLLRWCLFVSLLTITTITQRTVLNHIAYRWGVVVSPPLVCSLSSLPFLFLLPFSYLLAVFALADVLTLTPPGPVLLPQSQFGWVNLSLQVKFVPWGCKYKPRMAQGKKLQFHSRVPDELQIHSRVPDELQIHSRVPDELQIHSRVPDELQIHSRVPAVKWYLETKNWHEIIFSRQWHVFNVAFEGITLDLVIDTIRQKKALIWKSWGFLGHSSFSWDQNLIFPKLELNQSVTQNWKNR